MGFFLAPLTFMGTAIFAPFNWLAGFSAIGPVAGTATAWFQSVFGAAPAFSFLQSAAMGGYGMVVYTVAGGGAVIGGMLGALGGWFGGG